MSSHDIKSYMGNLWIQREDDIITVGISEEAVADFDEVSALELPEEQDRVVADEVCGAVETSDGPIDIYSPVTGTVLEVNSAVIDDPSIIIEDPTGDGWILKVTAEDDDDLDDEDDEDYDDDEDEDDEDDEDYEDKD